MSNSNSRNSLILLVVPAGIATLMTLRFFIYRSTSKRENNNNNLSVEKAKSVEVKTISPISSSIKVVEKEEENINNKEEKKEINLKKSTVIHNNNNKNISNKVLEDSTWYYYDLIIPSITKEILLTIQDKFILENIKETVYREVRAIVNVRKSNYDRLHLVNEAIILMEQMISEEVKNAINNLKNEINNNLSFHNKSNIEKALYEVRKIENLCYSLSLRLLMTSINGNNENEIKILRKRLLLKIVKSSHEFINRLSPFANFLIGRFLLNEVETEKEIRVVSILLHQSINHISSYESNEIINNFPLQITLPLNENIPFYASEAYYDLAQLLEVLESKQVSYLHDFKLIQELFYNYNNNTYYYYHNNNNNNIDNNNNDNESNTIINGNQLYSLQAYQRAIELSNGNNSFIWSNIGKSLMKSGVKSINIFKEFLTISQCFAEAIRCNGGIYYCKNSDNWRDVACTIRNPFSNENISSEINNNNNNNSCEYLNDFIYLTKRCNEPFIFSHRYCEPGYVIMNKKTCLVYAINNIKESSENEFLNWCDLALCLSSHVEKKKALLLSNNKNNNNNNNLHYSLCEEFILIREKYFSRLDCLREAIQLNPSHSILYYYIALTMEDEILIHNIGATADDNVCRQKFSIIKNTSLLTNNNNINNNNNNNNKLNNNNNKIFTEVSMNRVEVLCHGLSQNPKDFKLWFALGLSLFKRNSNLIQPEEWKGKITLKVNEENDDKNNLNEKENEKEIEEEEEEVWGMIKSNTEYPLKENISCVTIYVSAADCFDKCKRIDLNIFHNLESWLQKHGCSFNRENDLESNIVPSCNGD